MEHVAPLIQTILWVALIGGIVWRFNKPIHGLLTALQHRVEGGSTIKAGPFELADQLRPQEPKAQKEKVAAELLEVAPPQLPTPQVIQGRKTNQALLFQVEDLALRAIQSDYGEPISRQLSAGSDYGFDGVFTINGRLNIVEVKYVRERSSIPRLRSSLEKIFSAVSKYNWRNVQLILAVVFENAEDIPLSDELLLNTVKDLGIKTIVRPFSLAELQTRFGLETGGNG